VAATIRWDAIGALMLASAAVMGSPGPATLGVAVVGSTFGLRRALAYLVGIVVGTTLVLLAVASGITATLLAVPALHVVLLAFSGAYILWLAYRIATAPPLAGQNATAQAPSFLAATVFAVANPKAWVAIAAVFASARLADAAVADAVAKTAVLTVMIVLIMVGWLLVGASLAPVLRDARRARIVNVTLAALLVVTTALAVAR
jgi:threonine/homoserine/homoserine lactone efflux protein